ncbi:MAG: TonB-dependent receptor [Cyclobacteriaceae bacterium]
MKRLRLRLIALIFSSLFFVPLVVSSQELTQTVRGEISEFGTGEAMPGATINVVGTDQGTTSDATGKFSLKLPLGYHRLVISFIGYQNQVVEELLVTAGKEIVLDILLKRSAIELADAQVSARALPLELSSRTISPEQVQRYAATFYDPVRLSVSLPAVSATNDQNNNVSVRGTSPAWNQWRLEGLEIASPNHLTNAGTFSDRPTQNGGGVNILSAQMLSDSKVLYGGFNASRGNALGAIFDMNLRTGNESQRYHTVQASLIGFDLSTEGPFSDNSQASYLVNYRYSFTGLLGAMGVDFGGEEIRFQDISFTLNFPHKKGATKVFGLGGLSSNEFTGVDDFSEAEEEKDLFDISFSGKMMAAGVSNSTALNSKVRMDHTVIYSLNHSERSERSKDFNVLLTPATQSEGYNENKLSLRSLFSFTTSDVSELSIGMNAINYRYNLPYHFRTFSINPIQISTDVEASEWLWQPFVNFNVDLGVHTKVEAGLNFTNFKTSDEFTVEPRLFIKRYLGDAGSSVYFRGGLYSQIQNYILRYGTALDLAVFSNKNNANLEMNKAAKFLVGYLTRIGDFTVNAEAFYDYYYDLPYFDGIFNLNSNRLGSSFSSFNVANEIIQVNFTDQEEASVKGIEFSVEKKITTGWYYLIGTTYYNSTFENPDGETYDSRWDGGFALNGTFGKEIDLKSKNNKQRSFNMNARVIYQGGFRRNAIDVAASNRQEGDVINTDFSYATRNPNYFRLDLRFAWRVEKENYTRTLSFDLQNATNYENFFFERYDSVAGEVVSSNQLGIIPLLTYRVEF